MILAFNGTHPAIPTSAFVAPSVDVIGDVSLGEEANLWFGTVVRGDIHYVRIGRRTNIQDNCTVHVTEHDYPTVVGDEVTVGHNVVLHGCIIEDRCLIGMGAVVMDDVEVGAGSLIAGGAVLIPGTRVPPGSLFAGVPAKFRREVTDEERQLIIDRAEEYVALARQYQALDSEVKTGR
ncbi:MAG: gamma carbonic anhydrase family protein [Fidelibacterota bacterium]|nr:MAG: gamma carbonic anhydrase family protein [Candidatus Neomarinimicrobiota bacterium]